MIALNQMQDPAKLTEVCRESRLWVPNNDRYGSLELRYILPENGSDALLAFPLTLRTTKYHAVLHVGMLHLDSMANLLKQNSVFMAIQQFVCLTHNLMYWNALMKYSKFEGTCELHGQ